MADFDEETQARLHDFWSRFKYHLIGGLLMILAAVAGLSYQTTNNETQRRIIGNTLYDVIRSTEDGDLAAAEEAYAAIDTEHFASARHVAAFVLASLQVYSGSSDRAQQNLREVLERENDGGLRSLAALRVAELLINDGQAEDALEVLDDHAPAGGQMQMLFAERRGDAHFAAGRPLAARDEYNNALQLAAGNSYQRYIPILNIKIGAALSQKVAIPADDIDDSDLDGGDDEVMTNDAPSAAETSVTLEESAADN